MKKNIIHLLFTLFQEQEEYDIGSYESIDDFYSYIGYDLESENLLVNIGINGTSDLQKLFLDYLSNLNGELSDERFEIEWL